MMRLTLMIGLLYGVFAHSVSSVSQRCGTRQINDEFISKLSNMNTNQSHEQLMISAP